MTRLPRILSGLLLLAGAIAWLLGPNAPAQPRGAAAAGAGPAPPWGAEEVWLEGPVEDPAEPEPEPRGAANGAREPARPRAAALSEPSPPPMLAGPPAPAPAELPAEALAEPPPVREPAAEPPDADVGLDLVRRMLAIHARMGEP